MLVKRRNPDKKQTELAQIDQEIKQLEAKKTALEKEPIYWPHKIPLALSNICPHCASRLNGQTEQVKVKTLKGIELAFTCNNNECKKPFQRLIK